jgi:molybdopterin synthase sulfur carrier subunit
MPIIRLPSLMQYYTDKQNNFIVPGSTAIEAVRAAVEKYPALKFHVFDSQEHLRRHINLFVNDTNIRDLTGLETPVSENDVVRILPAVTGGSIDSTLSNRLKFVKYIYENILGNSDGENDFPLLMSRTVLVAAAWEPLAVNGLRRWTTPYAMY